MFEVTHHIALADGHAHLLSVRTTVRLTGGEPLPSPLTAFMPVWTPGSYLVREYARHVEGFAALADGKSVPHAKARKNAWRIEHGGATTVTWSYLVYANDLSVRTNHVDTTHAYWNGAATLLALEGAADLGARVVVDMPAEWKVATPLEIDRSAPPGPPTFRAKTFDELCDSPFECGRLIERSFVAHRKAHRIAAWDNEDARAVDWDKLATDTQTIIETEAALIAGARSPEDALPYDRYTFLWHVSPRARGGLEHRTSSTLMAKPVSFQSRTGYLDVLSLIAHEFFHLWNVKRIRPAGLAPYRYEAENHTRLLWWFEGATSYYDWRTLLLAKLCTAGEYLHHLAEEIARLEDTPGAEVHSLEESSYDAWIKAYRPDESSLNTTVSYYLKGEIVCALLDLELRRRTDCRVSLDDVVRHLYWDYGATDKPVPEGQLPAIFRELAGASFDDCFLRWVRGKERVEVNEIFARVGLRLERSTRKDGPPAAIGARLKLEGGRAVVDAVPRGGAAHKAGLDTKDEIIAIAGRRLPEERLELPLHGLSPGARVSVLVARDGWLKTIELVLDPPPRPDAKIVARSDADEAARTLYEAWMGEPLEQLKSSR